MKLTIFKDYNVQLKIKDSYIFHQLYTHWKCINRLVHDIISPKKYISSKHVMLHEWDVVAHDFILSVVGLDFLKIEELLSINNGKCDQVTRLSRPKHWNEHATTHVEVYIVASTPHTSWWMMGFSSRQMNKTQGPYHFLCIFNNYDRKKPSMLWPWPQTNFVELEN